MQVAFSFHLHGQQVADLITAAASLYFVLFVNNS